MERDGSTATFVNVLIVTDSQHGSGIFRGGLWQSEEGRRASQAFIPLSLPVCLSYLFLSFPGRAGSQTEGERMISFRMVGAFFCKDCLKLYRLLWGKGGGGRYNSCTV